MSLQVTKLVWSLKLKCAAEKLVLLKFADYADKTGRNAFPAIETVAKATGLSKRQTQRYVQSLVKSGYLDPTPRGRRKSYTVRPEKGAVPDRNEARSTPIASADRRSLGSRTAQPDTSATGDAGVVPQVTPTTPRGDTGDAPGVTPVSPDPSLIRHERSLDLSTDLFINEFKRLYQMHRGVVYGARRDDPARVEELLAVYGFDPLIRMAELVLVLEDDDWIAKGDRSIAVLRHRAPMLAQWVRVGGAEDQPHRQPTEWDAIYEALGTILPRWDCYNYFRRTKAVRRDGDVLVVSVESTDLAAFIERNFATQLAEAIRSAGAGVTRVAFEVVPVDGREAIA